MTLHLSIVSDPICPWCYVGKAHLAQVLPMLASEGLVFDILWRPFQLNPDMQAEGVDRRIYRTRKFGSWERSQQLDAGVARSAAAAGLPIRHDLMQRTPNTIASHILLAFAHEHGGAPLQDRVVDALFAAYFVDGQDIGAIEAYRQRQAGIDPPPIDQHGAGQAIGDPGRTSVLGFEACDDDRVEERVPNQCESLAFGPEKIDGARALGCEWPTEGA